jgi:hypothetical protein
MHGSHALLGQRCAEGPRAMTTLRIVVLSCVLAAVAITLKIRLDTPQGPQPWLGRL